MTYLLRWILEIVVEGDDVSIASCPDADEQGIVLPEVAHQAKAANPCVRLSRCGHDLPALVGAAVDHEDDLVSWAHMFERRGQTRDELGKDRFRSIDRNYCRYAFREAAGSSHARECSASARAWVHRLVDAGYPTATMTAS